MKSKITIVGVAFEFEGLDIGRTQVFPGVWHIVASAIRRTSKNRYQIYLILKDHAYNVDKSTIGDAVAFLQKMYDKYGKIPIDGDFQGGKDEKGTNDVT